MAGTLPWRLAPVQGEQSSDKGGQAQRRLRARRGLKRHQGERVQEPRAWGLARKPGAGVAAMCVDHASWGQVGGPESE